MNIIKIHALLNLILLTFVITGLRSSQSDSIDIPDVRKENPGKEIVVVLDTGLDLKDPRFEGYLCKNGHKDLTGHGIEDYKGHGTHVAGLITKHAGLKGYCLVIVKFYHMTGEWYAPAFKYAFALKPDFINFSGNGAGFYGWEKYIIAINDKTTFVVAAGNDNLDLDLHDSYPVSYNLPNMRIVGNLGEDYKKAPSSNYGSIVDYWQVGTHVIGYGLIPGNLSIQSGSSMSCGIQTGIFVKEKINEKYFAAHP